MSVHRVLAARRFRVVFGVSLLLSGPAAFAAITSFELSAVYIAGAWILSFILATLASLVPAAVTRAAGGPRAPVGPFASPRLDREEVDRAVGFARSSVTLPLVALAFVAPLSSHAIVNLFVSGGQDFGKWIAFSVIVVPHAHIVLAVCAARFSRQFVEGRNPRPPAVEGAIAVGFATLAAAIPGIVLIGLPPALTLLTGMVFAPLAFWLVSRSFAREEIALRRAEREQR